eukprot:CAMPEP_0197292346 /NCGR_PEP_ID=MMETSP0890-20130614/22647_1 /TAXON_ID=44058 ORGANISM="Aureoumbra lagunensis, Strain CCMP1510" /NCGR_SAMPLE_ID=MMETSP0890 /ASSEMBLY_ACC=CAM_ASM_000533 /LENGTH=44 /DNA_ID= /DNA_START= /DNA_END= /DNA_ORIENTATION=
MVKDEYQEAEAAKAAKQYSAAEKEAYRRKRRKVRRLWNQDFYNN